MHAWVHACNTQAPPTSAVVQITGSAQKCSSSGSDVVAVSVHVMLFFDES